MIPLWISCTMLPLKVTWPWGSLFTLNVPRKVFAAKRSPVKCLSPFNMLTSLAILPLAQVRPSSRSEPSGHSQSKEPRVFTHLEPTGQGSVSHSSASEHLMQLHEFTPHICRPEQARADTHSPWVQVGPAHACVQ